MKKISQRLFIVLLVLGGIVFYYSITNYDFFPVIKKALAPVIGGFVIAYLLDPAVRLFVRLGKGKIKRGIAILITVLLLIGLIILLGAVLVPSLVQSLNDIVIKITDLVENGFSLTVIEDLLAKIDNNLADEVLKYLQDSFQTILKTLGQFSTLLLNGTLTVIQSTSSGIVGFFMAFVVALYMLSGKEDLLGRVKRLNYAVLKKIQQMNC